MNPNLNMKPSLHHLIAMVAIWALLPLHEKNTTIKSPLGIGRYVVSIFVFLKDCIKGKKRI